MKQLVALGYVAPPGDDVEKAIAAVVAELKYNLARAYDDAGRPDLSGPLFEALLAGDPGDARFARGLVGALIATGEPRPGPRRPRCLRRPLRGRGPRGCGRVWRRIEKRPNRC